jgi:hypothetical protein
LGDETRVQSSFRDVAYVLGDYDHEDEWPEMVANAHLITAAPDLLEALEAFIAVVGDSNGVAGYHLNGDVATWGESCFDFIDDARAAIAKARGE